MTLKILAVVTTSIASASCAPGANAQVFNDCIHPVNVFFGERPSYLVGSDFDLEVHRESPHTRTLESGASREVGLQPSNTARTVMIIVYGAETAKVDYFGDQLTGSLDYTISGDMCLEPAEKY